MKKTYLLTFILLFVSGILLGYELRLDEKGEYFLPYFGRYETPNLTVMAEHGALDYGRLPHRIVAKVDWENEVVIVTEYIGSHRPYETRIVPLEDFKEFLYNVQYIEQYQAEKEKTRTSRTPSELHFEIPVEIGKTWRTVVGEGGVGLKVSGMHEITLQGRSEWQEGQIYVGSRFPSLHMEQRSNFNITGTIGSKIKVDVNQDSERSQSLENTINIKYDGEEDDIIQSIEAGNTNIGLRGAQFVGYSERVQGLFGLKSEFRIGDLEITAIASQEQGQNEKRSRTAGATRNEYEIKDVDYKKNTYFWIDDVFLYGYGLHGELLSPGDSISDFDLYTTENRGTIDMVSAWACYDVVTRDTTDVDDAIRGSFYRVDEDDYWLNRKEGWFSLDSPFPEGYTLAARYIVNHADGTADTVGQINLEDGQPSFFKLIKPYSNQCEPCWEYMWRNVYDLKFTSSNLNPEEVMVDIITIINDEDTYSKTGQKFVDLFGMDSLDLTGAYIPDGYVDPVYIDYARGELLFPVPKPFAPGQIDTMIMPSLRNFEEEDQVPAIYDINANPSDLDLQSNYAIRVETSARSATMDLGWGVLEGSETVKLNGEKLIKGTDYLINYQIGEISFISDRAKDPNANITVDYEMQPIFMIEQKTLLGARAKYYLDLEEESWIGSTALYRSVSMVEQRPRVGGEPTKAFIWDVDLNIQKEVPFMTAAVDALPLIETDAESQFNLQAEYAQIHANPNTYGEAYVDDFEGVKSSMDLGIRRLIWKASSPPDGYEDLPRGGLWWYNPYDKVRVTDIWENKDVAAQDSKTDVLELSFFPPDEDCDGMADDVDTSWVGIMRYLNPGYNDMTEKQFLEIWVRGDEGIINVDLGHISEDINDNSILDSEDQEINGIRDGILVVQGDINEDTGLDGMLDSEELIYYLMQAGFDEMEIDGWTQSTKEAVFDSIYPCRDHDDPSGDNYDWDDRDDYSHINGTEGNRDDPEGGKSPDTEDLNDNNYLDRRNDYYTFSIDLSSTDFEVEGTRRWEDDPSSWRLYRVPIQDSIFTFVEDGKVFERKQVGTPDWQNIEYVRLWVKYQPEDGDTNQIQIAELKLVGSNWLEQSDNFHVSQKNTYENEDYRQNPPPGVTPITNHQTGVEGSEQAMVLRFDNLAPLDTAYCYKTLLKDEDYTLYRKLEMFVRYDSTEFGMPEIPPEFFFRMGSRENIYYEFRMPLAHGWEDNMMVIDFEILTGFKNAYEEAVAFRQAFPDSVSPETAAIDSIIANPSIMTEWGEYRIVGTYPNSMPTLTQIKYMSMGIVNPDENASLSGEVWVNELRVTDVRDEPGAAKRAQITTNFADFIDVTGQIMNKEDDFHGLTESKGSGSDETTGNVSTTFHIAKFFPDKWGITLPFRATYSEKKLLPRLKPRSDIILPEDEREGNKTTEQTEQFSTNFAIRPEDAHPLFDLTLGRMTLAYSTGRTVRHEPTLPYSLNRNWTATHTYDLQPRDHKDYYINLLGWAGDSTSNFVKGFQFRYLPTKISFNTSVTQNKTVRRDLYNTVTPSEKKQLNHTTIVNTNFFEPLTHSFNLNIKRDITRESSVQFRHPITLGVPQSKDITNNFTFKPDFLKDYITQTYTFNSKYTEDTDPARYRDKWGKATQNQSFKLNLTLNHLRMIGEETRRGRSRPSRREEKPEDTEEEQEDEPGGIVKAGKWVLKSITAPKITVQSDYNATLLSLAERPSLYYQMGLTREPGADFTELTGNETQQQTQTWKDSYSLNTGLKLPLDIDTDLAFNHTREKSQTSSLTEKFSTTFPDMKVTWGRIGQLAFFKNYTSSVRAQSAYKMTKSVEYRDGEKTSESTKYDLNPVFSLNVNWRMGLQSNFSWNRNITDTRNTSLQNTITRSMKNAYSLTLSYNLSARQGIKLPIFGKVEFDNTLNLKLTGSYNHNRTEERFTDSDEVTPRSDTEEISIVPGATYKFSRNIDASFSFTYMNSNDLRTHTKRRMRQVSIKITLRF